MMDTHGTGIMPVEGHMQEPDETVMVMGDIAKTKVVVVGDVIRTEDTTVMGTADIPLKNE